MAKQISTASDPKAKVLCQRIALPVNGTCWREWKLCWDLPKLVTPEMLIRKHSVKNLLAHLEMELPLQVIEHRGMSNLGKKIQECTESALMSAVGEAYQRNLVELDVALTSDGVPIALHDLNPWRVANLPDKLAREFHSSEIVGQPIIIREVINGIVSDVFVSTRDKIERVDYLMDRILEENDGATVFLDCRDLEAHVMAAWLSYRNRYHQNVVLIFYSFQYNSGDHFVKAMEEANPAVGWWDTIAFMPVLFPHEITRMAENFNLRSDRVEDLFAAGKWWVDSVLRQPIRVVAVEMITSNVTPQQMNGSCVPEVIRAFMADHAAVQLADYIKNDPYIRKSRPHLKLANVTRNYDFSFTDDLGKRREFSYTIQGGREQERETDERRHIRQSIGLPGRSPEADWVISDRSEDEMSVLAWRSAGIERQVDHYVPHLDLDIFANVSC